MRKITWATVKTFQHPDSPLWTIQFADAGWGRWVRIDDHHCTRPVARVLADYSYHHTLRGLRVRFGAEIASSK